MTEPRDQFLFSRSARDLMELAARHADLRARLQLQRPLLAQLDAGRDTIEIALDAERRQLMRANEEHLAGYMNAARDWYACWPQLERSIHGLSLFKAHLIVTQKAHEVLPMQLSTRAR